MSYNDVIMARSIAFDYDRAVARATKLFRKHGYSNTSLRALLKVMNIGEGSFYNTVKSKERLYLECLKHYNETVGRERLDAFASTPSVKAGVRAFLATVLDQLDDPKTPNLCLMAGSISSDVLQERELRAYVLSQMGTFFRFFAERLHEGKATGELPADLDPEVVVQILGTFLQGLFRTAMISYDRKQVERQIEVLLTGLGL
jgi:TetR/AcrR family transcriptional repressor of nem operon